jgi:hypothetical protein
LFVNSAFGHPENATDLSVKRSKTNWKLCVHTTCVKQMCSDRDS